MIYRNGISKAIFGFTKEETGERLREFFKKHTGQDVDFNKIQHYKSGHKLLLFSIPLDTIELIGMTVAGCHPKDVKCFNGLDEFIDWYENVFLNRITVKMIEKNSIFKTRPPLPLDYTVQGGPLVVRADSAKELKWLIGVLVNRYDFSSHKPISENSNVIPKGGSCPWLFVNVEGRSFVRGKVGISFAKPVFNRWLRVKDFLAILDIVYASDKINNNYK